LSLRTINESRRREGLRREYGPPLWSSGLSSLLQIQRSWVRFPALPDFLVLGLERGPPSLVSIIEKLLEKKRNGSGLESREYGRRDPSQPDISVKRPGREAGHTPN
jgi:hypothetical protein